MTRKNKANFMIFVATIFWGASYSFTKIGLGSFGVFNLIAIRFILGFAVSILALRRYIEINKRVLAYSAGLGSLLFMAFTTMTMALKYTTASNAGFLIGSLVIIIPIISFFLFKERIEKKFILGSLMALLGIGLITLDSRLTMNRGDILALLCAVLFALHIILTGKLTKKVDSISLGVFQLGVVGLMSFTTSVVTEEFYIPSSKNLWVIILFLSIICTAFGYVVQTVAQQEASSGMTGLLISLEPLFSAVVAYFILGEVMSGRALTGGGILLGSLILVQANPVRVKESLLKE